MHIENINFHFGHSGAGAAMLSALITSQTAEVKQQREAITTLAIGEYWVGQGGVYIGIGRGHDDLRDHHLILPTDTKAIFKNRMLGTYGIDVTGATSDHNGPANTLALADAGSELCKEILALEIEGHKDFYLMSRTDAQLCWANVPEQFEKVWHLTSTQYSADRAWNQYFYNGDTNTHTKEFEAVGRACRRLFL